MTGEAHYTLLSTSSAGANDRLEYPRLAKEQRTSKQRQVGLGQTIMGIGRALWCGAHRKGELLSPSVPKSNVPLDIALHVAGLASAPSGTKSA